MHWFLIHATPSPDAAPRVESREAKGAYVTCWIDFPIADGAELLARHYIQQDGWTPGEVEESRWVEEEEFVGTPGLQYFREAAEDGASFVFDMYEEGVEDDVEDDDPA